MQVSSQHNNIIDIVFDNNECIENREGLLLLMSVSRLVEWQWLSSSITHSYEVFDVYASVKSVVDMSADKGKFVNYRYLLFVCHLLDSMCCKCLLMDVSNWWCIFCSVLYRV